MCHVVTTRLAPRATVPTLCPDCRQNSSLRVPWTGIEINTKATEIPAEEEQAVGSTAMGIRVATV